MAWHDLGRPVMTSKMGNWYVFVLFGRCFVFGIIMMTGASPLTARCYHDSVNNKDASFILLRFNKVSSTKE